MATAGPNIAGTGANDAAVGTVAWSNPQNITADDTSYASSGSTTATGNYLKATDFGFSIPTGATIDGIEVSVCRWSSRSGSRYIVDNIVSLVVGGSVVGDNKADTVTQWSIAASTIVVYGANNNTWGVTLTAEDINASDFGFVLSQNIISSSISTIASADYISITVTYTEGGGGGISIPVVMHQLRQQGIS